MMELFNLIGYLFGFILWGAFCLVKNFGVAIIFFTLIVKLILMPFSLKQQRSMASNARFQKKQREIMERYKNDRVKAQQEVQKLMVKENVSATAGCLPMLAPMLVMLGVYYSVINPLTNTLHIASDKIERVMTSLSHIPGMGTTMNPSYGQIYVVKYFDSLKSYFTDASGNALFTSGETEQISGFAGGFNFLGWDLLATPKDSSFMSFMWLIPVLCFVTSVASMFVIQKINGTQMKGCMFIMVFLMPLFSAFIAYSVPGAVGFYWIVSTVLGFVQSLLFNIYYSPSIIEARDEARRVVLRRNQEAEVDFIEVEGYVAPSEVARIKSEEREKAKSDNYKKKSSKSKKSRK